MARPKAFNPADATRDAMQTFWEHGYHATSLNDLLSDMKLNRGSLYDTFGDKKQLFMTALAEYERLSNDMMLGALQQAGSARDAITAMIESAADTCIGADGQKCCLGLKAAIELAPHDADVLAWVRRVTKNREDVLAEVIERGQREKEINAKLEPRATARYLLTALAGLRVLGTTAPRKNEVAEVTKLILAILD
jgi:TetR/AcrR family transcriptional repressor of nem operon